MNTMKFKIGDPVIYAGFGAGTSRPYAVAATIKKVEYSEKIGQYIYHAKGEDGQNYCDIESNIIFDDRSLNAEDMQSLIGLNIDQMKRKIGWWWTLDNQNFYDTLTVYSFSRAGYGRAIVYVRQGVVTKVEARHFKNSYVFLAA